MNRLVLVCCYNDVVLTYFYSDLFYYVLVCCNPFFFFFFWVGSGTLMPTEGALRFVTVFKEALVKHNYDSEFFLRPQIKHLVAKLE